MDDDKIREQLNLKPENQPEEPPTEAREIILKTVQQEDLSNIEQVPMESQPEEEPKKRKLRRGTIPKLILSVILFVAGIALIIWSIKYEEPEPKPVENNTTVVDNNSTTTDVYTSIYKATIGEIVPGTDVVNTHESIIILRNDGTYVYEANTNELPTPKVGYYTVDNGNITLEEVISYGSDTCYYTSNSKDIVFNKYTGTISDDNITLKIDDKDYIYNKGSLDDTVISKYNEKWYVVNPINGVSPDNSTSIEEWTNCDNLEN